jgi:hypothetical protein
MKATILRFGVLGAGLMIGWFAIYWGVLGVRLTPENCGDGELLGWLSIIISLSFVYFGIRYYRDKVNNHTITFGRALGVGLLISLFPAVIFGLLDIFYAAVIDPHFMETYGNIQIAKLKATTPAAELPAKIKELKDQMEMYKNPFIGWLVMFFTVMPVGLIVSVLSGLILKRKKPDLATAN